MWGGGVVGEDMGGVVGGGNPATIHMMVVTESQTHPVIEELRQLLGDDAVVSARDEMTVYECDGFTVARGWPTAVVFPSDTAQVVACVRAIAKHDELQIVPRGSGTGLAGGAVAYGAGVLINTTRMTRIENIDLDNRVAVVQSGVRNLALSDTVAAVGASKNIHLHFSPDPSSQRASTIGGNVATNAGGINTLKHGVTSNHVLSVEMVLANGEVLITGGVGTTDPSTVYYDSVGPDLTGLICGSEGILGIVTRVWCKLVPTPEHFRTVYGVFNTTADACNTVADVVATGIVPTSMEMMDGAMIKVVEDAFHYGFPTTAQALLLIEIDGVDTILDDQLATIVDIAKQNHATDVKQCSDPVKRKELWSARKSAFGAIGRISRSYCTQDACVPRSKLPEVMDNIQRIGREYGLTITNVFHAGDGNVHPILLFDEDNPDEVQNTLRASEALLAYCISIGGTITGEHGVGVEKLHLMHKMFNPATIDTFQKIKTAFDPDHRINDGKLVPSDTLNIELLLPTKSGSPGGAMSH